MPSGTIPSSVTSSEATPSGTVSSETIPYGKERAEAIGGLVRSDAIAAAARRGSRADQHVLDDAMIDAVRLQEEAGLDVITDGEVRRTTWAQTPRFLDCFTSFPEQAFPEPGFSGRGFPGPGGAACPTVTGRVRDAARLGDMAADFEPLAKYLKSRGEYLKPRGDTPPRAKFTLPAPSYHRRYWSDERSKAAYSSVEEYLTEIRDYLREVTSRLIALGCDYIQLDAPNYGSLCDPDVRARMISAGRDPMAELAFDAELDSSLLPAGQVLTTGLTTALHICRDHEQGGHEQGGHNQSDHEPNGGRRSAGGYDAISAELFPRLRFDRLLLEYAPDQCAPNRYAPNRDCFAPLADVRDGTIVVLGLLTDSSTGASTGNGTGPNDGSTGPGIEAVAEARIAEAARLKPLPELALSTRCGFTTLAAQRTALEMVARVARRIWD
jgi:5-methyltetrahydropteroyltriglutamate--homocysteine methyltransferase